MGMPSLVSAVDGLTCSAVQDICTARHNHLGYHLSMGSDGNDSSLLCRIARLAVTGNLPSVHVNTSGNTYTYLSGTPGDVNYNVSGNCTMYVDGTANTNIGGSSSGSNRIIYNVSSVQLWLEFLAAMLAQLFIAAYMCELRLLLRMIS